MTVREVAKPTPGQDEVLIRVHAASVNRTDSGELRAQPVMMRLVTGLRRPRRTIFGMDFAGEVEAVGDAISAFRPGDRVFGPYPSRSNGAQADYVYAPERGMAIMPASARFEEPVVCEGACYAKGILERIALKRGVAHRAGGRPGNVAGRLDLPLRASCNRRLKAHGID